MRNRRTGARVATLAAVASLSLVAAACGSDEDDSAATDAPAAATEAPAAGTEPMATDDMGSMPMATDDMGSMPMDTDDMGSMPMDTDDMGSMPMGTDGAMMMEPSGPACASLPTDGEGSLNGMADDPAATAASNNPELTTLVAAVTEAGLVDTLNGPGPFTIFAPVNSAFEKIPAADLEAVLADTELLTSILTYHVLPEQLSSTQLIEGGTFTTVNGADLEVAVDGETVTINGAATVACADIPTANATVHLIDTVLMPPA